MSQVTNFDIPSSPLTMSGLAVSLEAIFAALGSINRGAAAPSNPFEGMLWWDSAATVEILKRYTVTAGWAEILSVNRSTGAVTFPSTIATLTGTQTLTNKTIAAGSNTLTFENGSGSAGGSLSGNVYWKNIGSEIFINWGALTHDSAHTVSSAVGVIPVGFRSFTDIHALASTNAHVVTSVYIASSGTITFYHRRWSDGALTAGIGINGGSAHYRAA